jgi:hypothetical protein
MVYPEEAAMMADTDVGADTTVPAAGDRLEIDGGPIPEVLLLGGDSGMTQEIPSVLLTSRAPLTKVVPVTLSTPAFVPM